LPAPIPFATLKGRDLEECVYWLLDAMGAKDLEWRTGGTGGGAAYVGRDLEARFYTPIADGELEAQKMVGRMQGRTGTVEPSEVQSAVNNPGYQQAGLCHHCDEHPVLQSHTKLGEDLQATHPKPKIKLWDGAQLERYLSRHPDVVLRLFSEALSLQGRIKALESRFWNKLEYAAPKALMDVWKARVELSFEPGGDVRTDRKRICGRQYHSPALGGHAQC
jgi:hypothetical protein